MFRDRPEYWDYAAFASLLVQGRNNLARAIETHRAGYAPPSGKRVGTVAELQTYFCEVALELFGLVSKVQEAASAPMARIFTGRDLYDSDPTRGDVIAAATPITDYYRGVLLLAREVRGVETSKEFQGVVDNLTRLVSSNLEGVDDFITRFVGLVGVLPTLARNDIGARQYHSLGLELDPDYELIDHIKRQIKRLQRPWRHWFGL
ncbi:hypothetical protein A7R75_02850 [Mycolicibacterium llatzerense]|nr:hypothetical protein [Mycolicibacterium llatzerense]